MKINEIIITESEARPFNKELDKKVISTLRQNCGPYISEVGGLWNAIAARPLWGEYRGSTGASIRYR